MAFKRQLLEVVRTRWEKKHARNLNDYVFHDRKDIEAYLLDLQLHYGLEVRGRTLVYLDQSMWIELQKVSTGRDARDGSDAMYAKLKEMVYLGKALCPISSAVYWELLKQSDPKSRLQTAKVMDELSLGYTTKGYIEILKSELDNVIDSRINAFDRAWQRVGMLEYPPEEMTALPPHMDNLVFRKFLIEIQNEMTLEELVTSLPMEHGLVAEMEDEITTKLQQIKNEDPIENYDNFEQLHRFEVAGIVRAIAAEIYPAHFKAKDYAKLAQLKEVLNDENIIQNTIPMIYATSGIQALLRQNKTRKYTNSDHFDVQHSSFGLAYCDVLLTERGFGSLLREGPLRLDQFYNTKVLSTARQVADAFKSWE